MTRLRSHEDSHWVQGRQILQGFDGDVRLLRGERCHEIRAVGAHQNEHGEHVTRCDAFRGIGGWCPAAIWKQNNPELASF